MSDKILETFIKSLLIAGIVISLLIPRMLFPSSKLPPCYIHSVESFQGYALMFVFGFIMVVAMFHLFRNEHIFIVRLLRAVIFISILLFIFSIIMASLHTSRGNTTGKRIAQMRMVQSALNEYYKQIGLYPVITKENACERWKALEPELEHYLSSDFMPRLPSDPRARRNIEYQYDYKSATDGSSYVIKANLHYLDASTVLENDIDGEIFGVDCDDPMYCIGPE
ncbi:MAG: hypothetical protein A3G49_05620 [Candidatus Sungbacteria bacterium RIFCSPLOWO2_12_FULL_41_11]|uniref:Type II secretion system protein GspG C-terminal domain-containing protein n=1 Tax=Candidatus Sungbacteria bacterium RIFCSPLOWO2_12_FULL_41_11 TaxID=1802286 RepID=A0A1G2LUT6_9BACT|nr:MAG: hypothetical protein UV01_C0008G0031 [Parcubacteria group bacterium GW2011_GWA2_42_14]OGZ99201.1 MAG: hypothetical protein A3D41_02780 [Candidatus Sungbacteria bacterium RIFCSPHIGHO2_02_FULL_41_12b]OHA14632.1 MAG: hypothetical protein A3G49_05620 [Candidatus Sungbacteria bacterium RIFCSPLOWO2_12_FULL_41_11]